MLISATATSLFLQSADPVLITVGAVAGLMPDVDISRSWAGRALPWISRYMERRFPHRSCTHSLFASFVVALITYPVALWLWLPLSPVNAFNIGYFAGWLADIFTAAGVEMFFPSPARWVVPGNRKYRLTTNSQAEYVVLGVVLALALFVFNVNATGGMLQHFNRLLASPEGVEQVYNQQGGSHLVIAHIRGVLERDRTPIQGDFLIIQGRGHDFIVQAKTGEIYKAGIGPECQILVDGITADAGTPAITEVEPLALDEDQLQLKLQPFNRSGAMVFVSGRLTIKDDEELKLLVSDSYQFQTIKAEANGVLIDSAPLSQVLAQLGEEFATGRLSIRSIYAK